MFLGQRGRNSVPTGQWSRAANQSVANAGAGAAGIIVDTTAADRYGIKNATTASRLVVPNGWAGTYFVAGAAQFAPVADTTKRYVWFDVNGGGSTFWIQADSNWNSGTLSFNIGTSGTLRLNAGDYVEFIVRQDTGGNLNVVSPSIAMTWLCP